VHFQTGAKNSIIKDPALYIAVLFIAAPSRQLGLSILAPWAATSSRLGRLAVGFECRARTVPPDYCQRLAPRAGPMFGACDNCPSRARRIALWSR